MVESNQVFSGVQLQEKNIEPEFRNQEFLNRNFQLGNIPKGSFKVFAYRMQRGLDFKSFPKDHGGFLSKGYGEELIKKNEALLVLSGSVGGFVRDINQTNKIDSKQEQTSRGAMSSMFSKK